MTPRRDWLVWMVIALGLLGAYIVGYYRMGYPARDWTGNVVLRFRVGTDSSGNVMHEISPGWERFYAPMQKLDRMIRPDVWKPMPPPWPTHLW